MSLPTFAVQNALLASTVRHPALLLPRLVSLKSYVGLKHLIKEIALIYDIPQFSKNTGISRVPFRSLPVLQTGLPFNVRTLAQ
jgi:hypothetical protein